MSRVERIADAAESDAPVLEDLQLRSSSVWEEYREQLAAHPDAIELPMDAVRDGRVRVAYGDSRILGFSVVLTGQDGHCELDGLFVEPDVMRGGVGRALMADVIATARREGAVAIDVTANPRAYGFYEKLGFTYGAPAETRFGPALRMHLGLKP